MQTLRFIHVVAMVIWLGTAAGELVMELVLWRTKSPGRQRAYIELHRTVDLVLEGPALLVTVLTGLWLLWAKGYFVEGSIWPSWFEDKLLCALVVVAANLICVAFVLLRARRTDALLGQAEPLSDYHVRKWHLGVATTFVAVPFALLALWFAVIRP